MNKNIICCTGDDYTSARRIERCVSIISHATLVIEEQLSGINENNSFFLTTPDDLGIDEMRILRRFAEAAVIAEDIYAKRRPRKYFLQRTDGDRVDMEIEAEDPMEALEEAISEFEVDVCCE